MLFRSVKGANGEFLCTGENPTEASPAPMEFTVSDQALRRSVKQESLGAPYVLTRPLIDDIRRKAAEAEAVQKGGNSRYA